MRWELLFGDLEAQWHEANQLDLERHVNELARVEASQLTLAEALRGSVGQPISLAMCNGTAFHGEVQRVEPQWMLLSEDTRSVVIPLAKVLRVQGLGTQRARAASKIQYSLAAALRVLARNRSAVVLELDTAHPASIRGVLDQVGADYVQLMQLADGVSRDRGNRQGNVVVPLGSIAAIVSAADNEF